MIIDTALWWQNLQHAETHVSADITGDHAGEAISIVTAAHSIVITENDQP